MKQADYIKIRAIYDECNRLAEVPNIQKYTFIDRVVHETEGMNKNMADIVWFALKQEEAALTAYTMEKHQKLLEEYERLLVEKRKTK